VQRPRLLHGEAIAAEAVRRSDLIGGRFRDATRDGLISKKI
jgi:hypothetical protein